MTRTARLCARSALHDHSLPAFRFDDPFTLDHNNRLVDSVGIDAELFGDLSHAWKEFAGRIGPAANRRAKAIRDLPKDRYGCVGVDEKGKRHTVLVQYDTLPIWVAHFFKNCEN